MIENMFDVYVARSHSHSQNQTYTRLGACTPGTGTDAALCLRAPMNVQRKNIRLHTPEHTAHEQ